MELTETTEAINQRLIEHFGTEVWSSIPIWRVVFSEDQFEKRYGTYDDITLNGIYIRTVTEVREVPKYRQWIHNKFVLERLVIVPESQQKELADKVTSYEPIWVFEDNKGNPLPPKWEAIKLIIDTIYSVQYGNHDLSRYKDPESTQEDALELHKKKIDQITEELFGDESGLLGTTITGESIIVPQNYKKVN